MTPGKSEGCYMRVLTVWTGVFLDWLITNEFMAKQRWLILMNERISLIKISLSLCLLTYFRIQKVSNVIYKAIVLHYLALLYGLYLWTTRVWVDTSALLTNIYSVCRSEFSRVVQICGITSWRKPPYKSERFSTEDSWIKKMGKFFFNMENNKNCTRKKSQNCVIFPRVHCSHKKL